MLQSLNPATGEVVGELPIATPDEVRAAVARARAAQAAWADLGLEGRRDRLAPAGERIAAAADELGRLATSEMGKPLRESTGEAKSCGRSLTKNLAAIVEALEPDQLEDDHAVSTIHHDPLGVCACITPWNFPIAVPYSLLVPALTAGNTVVLKPSELTPLTGQRLAELFAESLPDDVLQVVHGADEQGRALVAAPVDLVAFTGSREAGKSILAAASAHLKRVVLELGGKDPLVVLDDADVEAAASYAVRNSFRNAGQVCVSTERIYVDDSIADDFERAVVEKTRALRVGPGDAEDTDVGPMVSEEQRDHVVSQVRDALAAGARALTGNEEPNGLFLTPTVLTDVSHDMSIMRDETFGPVTCIMRVRTDDEAVELANDTPFGLGASVFGADEDRAGRVARRLGAGMIGINRGIGGASGSPWVGARESGYGFHGSKEGHRQFTQARVVSRAK